MSQSSKIFLKNRSLGYVSNHVPLVVRYIKSIHENLVVTCVGRSFHTYECSRLKLLSVSGALPEDITCLAADSYLVYTAYANVIQGWKRGTELIHTYSGHTKPVHLLLSFGLHLVSIDEDSNLKLWNIKSEEVYLELTFDNASFEITTVLHPSTYLNKLLLGSSQGTMQLWNVLTSKLVYSFKSWGAAVTVLEQAPAVDVVAIGLANGKILIHNLKFDKTVMEFDQDWGEVTSLSFRTDGHPMLASGTLNGHIVFWDLEERKVTSQLLSAHNAPVTGLRCLPNEPTFVSSSADNSLKVWIFDMPDGGARKLLLREGHGAPPTSVRYYGENGHNILSSGADSSLRKFSTITEALNQSFGKASFAHKASKTKDRTEEDPQCMPPILHFTSETTREKEWDNIVALHAGLPDVTTWSSKKCCMGDLKLKPERFFHDWEKYHHAHVTATSLCLTNDGNFVVIGYSTGHVDKFNIQSGLHRTTYGSLAHVGPVRGVMTDGLNQLTITGGRDRYIKFWPFKSAIPGEKQIRDPLSLLYVKEAVAFFCTHRESSIVAIALEDFTVTVVDVGSRTVIRVLEGHTGQLMDAAFSPDARWLVTASMDCTIRTWDIPSGQLIDCFEVDAACISLTFSPTGDMLATAHVNYLGVYLWSNRTLFSFVSLRPLSETAEYPKVSLPSSLEDDCQGLAVEVEEQEGITEMIFESPEQINIDLITLSSVANSRWQNLLNIDVVKKRNKPKRPLKVPKAAPFFLPTLPSLEFKFDLSSAADSGNTRPTLPLLSSFSNLTVFGKLLDKAEGPDEFNATFNKLKSLGPSAIDFEIECISVDGGGIKSLELMLKFMKLIEFVLKSKKDFELAQAYLGLFLRKHGEAITNSQVLLDYLKIIQACQISGWKNLQENLLFSLCVVDTLKTV